MDTEKCGEIVQTPNETVASTMETHEEVAKPEKPPAADKEADQLAASSQPETNLTTPTVNLVPSENVTEIKNEGAVIVDESEKTGSAEAPPEPHESHKKCSDSEPESTCPVADATAVPKPEVVIPEAAQSHGTLPELATPQQPADAQTPSQKENLTGQEEDMKKLKIDTGAEDEKTQTATEPTKKEEAKPAEDEMKEKEAEVVKPAGDVKEVKSEMRPAGVECEQDTESKKQDEVVPSPGSLGFALLDHNITKQTLQTSSTLIILKGLPGSGKSHLARVIADNHKEHCAVICADDHGVKPECPELSNDGYKALDEAVVACLSSHMPPSMVVVDDTNHTQDRLARLGEIALEHNRIPLFLEPRTEWRRNSAHLHQKTKRGLEQGQINAMKGSLEEMTLPLYFGWFLVPAVQDSVRCTAMDFLKTLDTLEVFQKRLNEFTGKAEKDVDLEQYYNAKGVLHCTTKFCDYGKAPGAKEYAEKQVVSDCYGSVFELSLSALFVTPRTVGARVSLTEEQLVLWPDDAEKEAESVVPGAAQLPLGSRAHVTLGCADGVESVQTGFDLLQILVMLEGEVVAEMELGTLSYFGEGRWLLCLTEPLRVQAFFSSLYARKECEPPKEKKKKKCTIL